MKTLGQVGREIADALEQDDADALRHCIWFCGGWTVLRRAAEAGGVDIATLEEAIKKLK